MIETLSPKKELEDLQADVREVQELLRRHRLVENLVGRQDMPKHELV
jgi:magnesium transporter